MPEPASCLSAATSSVAIVVYDKQTHSRMDIHNNYPHQHISLDWQEHRSIHAHSGAQKRQMQKCKMHIQQWLSTFLAVSTAVNIFSTLQQPKRDSARWAKLPLNAANSLSRAKWKSIGPSSRTSCTGNTTQRRTAVPYNDEKTGHNREASATACCSCISAPPRSHENHSRTYHDVATTPRVHS